MTGAPEERFDRLWQEHAAAVLRYARRRVLPSDVDDVVAETFVVAWRRIDDVPPVALPWLLAVARNVSLNTRRTRSRHDGLVARVAELGEPDSIAAADLPDSDSPAEITLYALPEADRELLTLIAWDGLSNEEAATVLNVSRATLRVRLHRARRRFAALLMQAPPSSERVSSLGVQASGSAQPAHAPPAAPRSSWSVPRTELPGGPS